jgi:predicted transcriptional regulator
MSLNPILEGADMPTSHRGSRIRTFRCPEELDLRMDQFCERTGTEATILIRTAVQSFLDKHKFDKSAVRSIERQKKSR